MSIIKKIRTLPVIAVLGALTCWSSIASADPITVDFEISGFTDGATLSGSFRGEDSNNSGSLDHSVLLNIFELSAFSLDWSGNSITAAFTQGLSDLRSLLYDIGGNTLVVFRSTQGGGFFSTPAATGSPIFADVNGPNCDLFFCGNPDYQAVKHPGVTTTQVPEPGTLTLFGIGLLAAGFASRRRQV